LIKKWTVILIPHDRGERRSFNMSDVHMWVAASILLLLCFTTAFFFQRSRTSAAQTHEIEQDYQALETAANSPETSATLDTNWGEREATLRAEYDQRDDVLVRELSRLYDLEKEVRIIYGLPTQISDGDDVPLPPTEGEGGRVGDFDDGMVFTENVELLPPHAIYGLSDPSADLMLQEIQLRTNSLQNMLDSMEAQQVRIAHTPSIWPTNGARRAITSRYGPRKDPITRRLSQHKGVDIHADYGSKILSSARGTVIFSAYHQYLGNCVKIDHGYGLESWYGHMSKRLVAKGDEVARGQVVGKVGSTGKSTGPHIHYEVHLNGKTVDPKNYIGH
jgi:murein DD-endopeptidase MepM/ murein hydrolase activator NlpD